MKGLMRFGFCLAVGCAAEGSTIVDFDYAGDGKDDIGGVEALGSSLNAIGTVGMMVDGHYRFFCSASLIGPTTVLTAKHCALDLGTGMKLVNLVPIYFAVGPDANNPTRTVEAVAADVSPVESGGFVGLGNDVAIYHLREPVTDVTPLKVANFALQEEDVGKKLLGVGYGSKDAYEDLTGQLQAHRRMGTKTLQARSGKAFELMLGSFEGFLDSLASIYGREAVEQVRSELQKMYDDTTILVDYEVWAGHVSGDSQTCHGDSGGPLIAKVANESGQVEKMIFGVVSGGWFSRDLPCDYGTYYATFGSRTQALIESTLAWSDPCAGGLTEMGRCEGTEAVRCTGKWEGNRRATRVDCGVLDLACGQDAVGQVACVDPASAPGTLAHEELAEGETPTVEVVRTNVTNATIYGLLHQAMQLLGDPPSDTDPPADPDPSAGPDGPGETLGRVPGLVWRGRSLP